MTILPSRSTRGKRTTELSTAEEELWQQLLKESDNEKEDPDYIENSDEEDEEEDIIDSDAVSDEEEEEGGDGNEENETKSAKKKSSKSYKDPKSKKSSNRKKPLSDIDGGGSGGGKSAMETELEKHLDNNTSTNDNTPNKRKRKELSPPKTPNSEPTSPSTRRSSQRSSAIEQLQKSQPQSKTFTRNKKLKVDDDGEDNGSITNRSKRSTRNSELTNQLTITRKGNSKKSKSDKNDEILSTPSIDGEASSKFDTISTYGLTQEELLEECKETEIYNTESLNHLLQQEEDKKKVFHQKKAVLTGPRIVYRSTPEQTTITFTDSILPDCLTNKPQINNSSSNSISEKKKKVRASRKSLDPPIVDIASTTATTHEPTTMVETQKDKEDINNTDGENEIKKPIELCVITGLPAKYIDPDSKKPYANLEAYKILKERKRQEELQKSESKRRSSSSSSSSHSSESEKKRSKKKPIPLILTTATS
ncbi:hypothetical protein ACTFIV_006664 [Dictyostelium citrinum]